MRREGTALDIGHQITHLKRMTVRELRAKYHDVFGEPTRATKGDFLVERIAWRTQSLAEGDLSERARRRAAELARDADIRTTIPRSRVEGGAKPSTPAWRSRWATPDACHSSVEMPIGTDFWPST